MAVSITNHIYNDAMDLVEIPGCEFIMGSDQEEIDNCFETWINRLIDSDYRDSFSSWLYKEYPAHPVRVADFRIGRFPVTNRDYAVFLADVGRPPPESIATHCPDRHPVWGVTYTDAEAYAEWLGTQLGMACRLPTEAEWECAARGPAGDRYPFGEQFDSARCNTIEAGIGTTTPVDHYPSGASGYGLFDLAGNVEEWTAGVYAPYPGGTRVDDDISRAAGPHYHVLRGGCFALGGDLARCARRHGPHPAPPFRYRGFRVVAQ